MRKLKNPPKTGSNLFKSIVKKGCGGYCYWTDCGYEYDCKWDYPWECDKCPLTVERYKGDDFDVQGSCFL